MAFFPLRSKTGGKDIGPRKNHPARLVNTPYGKGPDGSPGTSVKLKGRPDSYIEFPNRNGKLDPRRSMTFVGYVYPEEKPGPIFNYNTDGSGVEIWQKRPNILFVRYVTKKKKTKPLVSVKLVRKVWNWIGTTYNHVTGEAKLYINSKPVSRRRIGARLRLATTQPVRTGAILGRKGNKRYFRGRVTCFQVYSKVLTVLQIRAARKLCLKTCE